MINILERCNQIQQDSDCCHSDGRVCYCMNCLQDGFYSNDSDTYNCLKRLCFYTMNYGPIYVSEIYHFLGTSCLMGNFNSFSKIKILSIGCGFAPDYIAISKYLSANKLTLKFDYTGYDIEENWKYITSGIINDVPEIYDALSGFSLSDFHIVFLNKLFSTLKNNGTAKKFLDIFVQEIEKSLPVGSFVVFNDINHWNMGRDMFDTAISTKLTTIGKYYFNVREAYQGNYTEIASIDNISFIPSGLPITPLQEATKSVFFLYQKQA